MIRVRLASALALLVLLLWSVQAQSAPTKRIVRGTARSNSDKAVAYTQQEVEEWDGNRQIESRVTYRSPDGAKIGSRVVRAQSAATMPDEVFEDLRSGTRCESRVLANGKVEVVYRKASVKSLERKTFLPSLPAVNGAGVIEAIRGNWAKLQGGGRVEMALIVPERLDWYHFRLRKVGKHKRGDHETTSFVLEPDSMLLRAVAGQFHFEFKNVGHGLVRYSGRVDLTDADGDPYKITVRFTGGLPGEQPTAAEPASRDTKSE